MLLSLIPNEPVELLCAPRGWFIVADNDGPHLTVFAEHSDYSVGTVGLIGPELAQITGGTVTLTALDTPQIQVNVGDSVVLVNGPVRLVASITALPEPESEPTDLDPVQVVAPPAEEGDPDAPV